MSACRSCLPSANFALMASHFSAMPVLTPSHFSGIPAKNVLIFSMSACRSCLPSANFALISSHFSAMLVLTASHFVFRVSQFAPISVTPAMIAAAASPQGPAIARGATARTDAMILPVVLRFSKASEIDASPVSTLVTASKVSVSPSKAPTSACPTNCPSGFSTFSKTN